jgi:outer membrane scaffolding protein for murein synthesis (MipA/OmpV family)
MFRKLRHLGNPMVRKLVFACAAALSLSAGAAHADGGWIVSVGAKGSVSPPYEGADHLVTRPSPTLSITRADKPYRFTPLDSGTTFALFDSKYVVFGPMVRFMYGRGDKREFQGFKKVDWAVEPGAFLDIWPVRWLRLHGEARHGFVGHRGTVGDIGADLVYQSARWDFSLGPRMGFGDDKYFKTYFGVTPEEAARSPLINAAYDAGSGRRYTGVEFGTAYHVTSRFMIKGDVGYHRLSDKVAASPVIELAGDRNQYSGSVGFTWNFHVGR